MGRRFRHIRLQRAAAIQADAAHPQLDCGSASTDRITMSPATGVPSRSTTLVRVRPAGRVQADDLAVPAHPLDDVKPFQNVEGAPDRRNADAEFFGNQPIGFQEAAAWPTAGDDASMEFLAQLAIGRLGSAKRRNYLGPSGKLHEEPLEVSYIQNCKPCGVIAAVSAASKPVGDVQ